MDKRTWPTGIRPSGRGLRIRIWQNRQPVYEETIACDPYSKRDLAAAVKRRKWLAARITAGLPLLDAAAKIRTLEHVAQDYIDTLDAKRSTNLSYENILNLYWMPTLGNMPPHEITEAQVKGVLASLKVSPKTKRNILIPLRGALQHAGISPNPAAGIKIRRHQKDEVDRYTPKERELLLGALKGEPKVYFTLLFACGLRPGEALALKWSDWDGEELKVSKQITKRRLENSTKTSMRRRVYVPTWARPALDAHDTRKRESWIFMNGHGSHHKDTDAFNDAWRKAHQDAKVEYRIPYVCRHTRAAELLSTGVSPAEAAKQLGHSAEMFLRVYSEVIDEYLKNQDKSRFEGRPLANSLANSPEE
jgi:integrase